MFTDPHITATIHDNGSSEVTVDGEMTPVNTPTVQTTRQAVVAFLSQTVAAPVGRPVAAQIHDPDEGPLTLTIHPDGNAHRSAGARPEGAARHSVPVTAHTEPVSPGPAPSPGGPATAPPLPPQPDSPPSLQDLRAQLTAAPEAPATWGWRGRLARAGLNVKPGAAELQHRRDATSIQRSLRGPKTIVIVNVKGGENKTGTCFLLGAAIGRTRGGFTLAWDNNETRGTLAWKGVPASHHQSTAVDFLHDLDRFSSVERSRVGDLDNYVRGQGDDQFDILASDEDASSMEAIDDQAFKTMHSTLERFYRVIIVDTGNNVKAPNYRAALDVADQLVVATTAGGDGVSAATWTMEHLQQTGYTELVRNAVTILSVRDKDVAAGDMDTYVDHLSKWTRSVVQIPHDEAMPRTTGAPINYDALTHESREAWLRAAAAVIGGLD